MGSKMYYSVIIADDEANIRRGLVEYVDWRSLGFEVIETFSDGTDVIKYLESNTPDVIFTDIKMVSVSGLDVAKYVWARRPSVKVVILSGFSEFEYAKSAIHFNVSDYLLKPTDFNEISQVFTKIKNELDDEKEKKAADEANEHHKAELSPLLVKQFFSDISMGFINDKSEINKRASELGIHTAGYKCFGVLSARFLSAFKTIKGEWKYSRDGLNNAVKNFLLSLKLERFALYPIFDGHNSLRFVFLSSSSMSENTEALSMVKKEISAFFHSDVKIEIEGEYSSLDDMSRNFMENSQKADLKNTKDTQNMLFSYICEGNTPRVNALFSSLMSSIANEDLDFHKGFVTDIFVLCNHNLRTLGNSEFFKAEDFQTVKSSRNLSEVIAFANERVTDAARSVSVNNNTASSVVNMAKRYIEENFASDVTLEEVAEKYYFNSAYLSKLYKEKTGSSFTDYLFKVRMSRASAYLLNPNYKIYEISEMIGYKTTRYFYKVFKEYTGLTPTEFRRKELSHEG